MCTCSNMYHVAGLSCSWCGIGNCVDDPQLDCIYRHCQCTFVLRSYGKTEPFFFTRDLVLSQSWQNSMCFFDGLDGLLAPVCTCIFSCRESQFAGVRFLVKSSLVKDGRHRSSMSWDSVGSTQPTQSH